MGNVTSQMALRKWHFTNDTLQMVLYRMAASDPNDRKKGGKRMDLPIPDFIPVPDPETMRMISIVSLIAGICLVGAGAVYLLLNKGKEKKSAFTWILICVGALLIVNHGIQLIF